MHPAYLPSKFQQYFKFDRPSSLIQQQKPPGHKFTLAQGLVKSDKVQLGDLPESGHIIGTALRLIDDGLYGDAKLLILESLPQQQQGMLHKPHQLKKKRRKYCIEIGIFFTNLSYYHFHSSDITY